MKIVRLCAFLSSVPCTNMNVQEKKRLVPDLGKIPEVEQTGFTTAFRVSKKSLRICACFENQELLNVFMILHSINSCIFNLQAFLIGREKVTLDLRGLSLSKRKKTCGGIWNMMCILKRVPGKIFVLAISIPTSSALYLKADLEIILEKM